MNIKRPSKVSRGGVFDFIMQDYSSFFLAFPLKNITKEIIANKRGKIRETAKPALKSSPKRAEVWPAKDGPIKHPKSPERASKPNIKTPPLGILVLAKLKEPGHIIPAPIPQRAQPRRERVGYGDTIVMMYEPKHMIEEIIIALVKLIFSEYLA